jgi:hypothetical protein
LELDICNIITFWPRLPTCLIFKYQQANAAVSDDASGGRSIVFRFQPYPESLEGIAFYLARLGVSFVPKQSLFSYESFSTFTVYSVIIRLTAYCH